MNMERIDFQLDLEKVKKTTPTLIFGDTMKILLHFIPNTIDLIVDDLPYDDLEKHRATGTTTRLTISKGSSQRFYKTAEYGEVIPLYKRILKPKRHVYFWRPSFNQESMANWDLLLNPNIGLLKKHGFKFRKVIPCIKNYSGMGYSYKSAHERLILADNEMDVEEIIFAYKRGSGMMLQLNDLSMPDYFTDNWKHPNSKDKTHVSEKPATIYKKLLIQSSNNDDIVLEPFAGSFQAGIVNTKSKLGRRVIGIENDKRIFDKTLSNFKDETGTEPDLIYMDDL